MRRSTLREMHEGQRSMRMDDYDAPIAQRTPDGISLRTGSYGFGWTRVTSCNDERVQHGGYEPGYFSTVVLLPKQAAGVFVFATNERVPAGALLGTLAAGDVLGKPAAPVPIEELVASAEAIDRLLAVWATDLVARTFDAPSLKFAWSAHLRDDFARIGASHGQCRRSGALKTHGRHRGVWTLACPRPFERPLERRRHGNSGAVLHGRRPRSPDQTARAPGHRLWRLRCRGRQRTEPRRAFRRRQPARDLSPALRRRRPGSGDHAR